MAGTIIMNIAIGCLFITSLVACYMAGNYKGQAEAYDGMLGSTLHHLTNLVEILKNKRKK